MGQIHVTKWAKIGGFNGRCQNTTGVREEYSNMGKNGQEFSFNFQNISGGGRELLVLT